jgi:hypothetical protein
MDARLKVLMLAFSGCGGHLFIGGLILRLFHIVIRHTWTSTSLSVVLSDKPQWLVILSYRQETMGIMMTSGRRPFALLGLLMLLLG